MQPLVFCHDTAIDIMRRGRSRLVARPRTELVLDDANCRSRSIAKSPWRSWIGPTSTIHLLTSRKSLHRTTARCTVHAWGHEGETWPVIELGQNTYVVSPEFLFLQMATALSELELAFLGFELCGQYGIVNGRVTAAPAVTSARDIEAFLIGRPRARGRAKALRVIRYVVDGSASPMETELCMRLTLPLRYGGYGLPKPKMNRPVALGAEAAAMYGFPQITPDLLWEDVSLALEYDSDVEHVGAERIARDSRRRLALEMNGCHVITVTNEQLRKGSDFDAIAHSVERGLRRRHRKPAPATLRARATLAREVHQIAIHPEAMTGSWRSAACSSRKALISRHI